MVSPTDLEGLILSAEEIGLLTGWPDEMIEDYLTILRNLIEIAASVDDETERIDSLLSFTHSLNTDIKRVMKKRGKSQLIPDISRLRSRGNRQEKMIKNIQQLTVSS